MVVIIFSPHLFWLQGERALFCVFPSTGQHRTEPCCATRTFALHKAIGDPPFLPYRSPCGLQLHLPTYLSQTLCQSCSAPRTASWGAEDREQFSVRAQLPRVGKLGDVCATRRSSCPVFPLLSPHPSLLQAVLQAAWGSAELCRRSSAPCSVLLRHPELCSHLGSAAGQSRACLAESPICNHCSLSSSSFKQRSEGRAAQESSPVLRVSVEAGIKM